MTKNYELFVRLWSTTSAFGCAGSQLFNPSIYLEEAFIWTNSGGFRKKEASEKAERIIANAADQSQKMLDETKKMGTEILDGYNRMGTEILEKANQEALKIVEAEKEELIKHVKENIGDLVLAILKKVTGKVITKEEQKKLFEKEVRNLS